MQGVEIMNKKEIKLSNGMEMPRLGMGTWFLGENRSKDAEERQRHSEQELMREYD